MVTATLTAASCHSPSWDWARGTNPVIRRGNTSINLFILQKSNTYLSLWLPKELPSQRRVAHVPSILLYAASEGVRGEDGDRHTLEKLLEVKVHWKG